MESHDKGGIHFNKSKKKRQRYKRRSLDLQMLAMTDKEGIVGSNTATRRRTKAKNESI